MVYASQRLYYTHHNNDGIVCIPENMYLLTRNLYGCHVIIRALTVLEMTDKCKQLAQAAVDALVDIKNRGEKHMDARVVRNQRQIASWTKDRFPEMANKRLVTTFDNLMNAPSPSTSISSSFSSSSTTTAFVLNHVPTSAMDDAMRTVKNKNRGGR